ncbi:hypothetical protein NP493_450g01010 [Ridgeia piscesae]|uniref:HTH CENPB-type domain-containing protein n=1 Tax=Ridgeia piscesae TaxID=27915 RepID=A0AAD9L0I2_RIDPI|nr:hypothetical protein NP493_450g01010 [Ridgeia piscesae]
MTDGRVKPVMDGVEIWVNSEEWKKGSAGYRQIGEQFNVPWSTLRDRLKNNNNIITGAKKGFAGGFRKVFTDEQEQKLCTYILRTEDVLLGLSRGDVRHVAYQMAVRNNLPHNFNNNTEMAGDDWLMSFRHRHPELSLRTPEATGKLALPQCKANRRKYSVAAVRSKLDV